MRFATRLAAALAFCAAGAALAAEPAPDTALHALFEREFRYGLEEFPERATFFGIEGHDHRFTDRSPAAVARRKARVPRVIAELERFDPARLSTQDRISREVMLAGLRLDAEENALYGDLPFDTATPWMAISSMFGPQSLMAALAKATRFRRAGDYDNYVKRLEALPASLEQAMDAMRAGMRSGWMPPAEAMARVPAMLEIFAGRDITATPMWRPFTQFPAGMDDAERKRWAEAGRRALEEKAHPAFARLERFLETEYLPAARRELSASRLPAGPAYYALRVRRQTTTAMTPAQIHELGLAEVRRIRAEMDRAIAAAGFKGSFAGFLHFINTDPQFFFTRPEDRLRAYRDIAKRADAQLPRLFAELPRTPYGIRPMEAFEGNNADNYSRPALDGSRAGFFNANVNNLAGRPSHEMEAVLLHETVPGHHLQIARAQELPGLPAFRRSGGYVAYTEGWALYAESLGYEMGFYKDPYMRFGALTAEMLRACRLVIDTGLHTRDWGRERSIRYLMANAGLKEGFATAEVDRYITNPGQALGERFDVRRFHNAVLDDGALPLTVLEARIDEWIARQQGRP